MLCSAYDFSEPYHTDDLENVSRATEFMDVDSPIVAKKLFFPDLKYTAALRKGVTISDADNKVEQVAAVGRMSPTPPRDQSAQRALGTPMPGESSNAARKRPRM